MSDDYNREDYLPQYQKLVHSTIEAEEAIMKFGRTLVDTLTPVVERILEAFKIDVPRYIIYELQHPRKKPRGSIRRARRNRRKREMLSE